MLSKDYKDQIIFIEDQILSIKNKIRHLYEDLNYLETRHKSLLQRKEIEDEPKQERL